MVPADTQRRRDSHVHRRQPHHQGRGPHPGPPEAPLTYPGMVDAIRAKHPEANTTVKTVQWYASRLRRDGEEVNVKDGRTADARRAA